MALADERPEIAAEAARRAAGEPGAQACRPVFAELLELEAMCTREPRVRERLLEDAQAMWTAARPWRWPGKAPHAPCCPEPAARICAKR